MRLRLGPIVLVALLGPGHALAAPHSVEELLRPARVRDIALSPDGSKVALALRSGNDTGDVLTIVDVGADLRAEPPRFSLGAHDRVWINWVDWATPRRLLIGVTVVLVHDVAAERMVRERVARLVVVAFAHWASSRHRRMPASAARCYGMADLPGSKHPRRFIDSAGTPRHLAVQFQPKGRDP